MVPRDFFVDLGVIHVPTDFHPCTLKWAPGLASEESGQIRQSPEYFVILQCD